MKRLKMPTGIRRILERDPAQRLFDELELVMPKADLKLLRRVTRQTKPRAEGDWIHVSDAMIPCDRIVAGAMLGIKPPRSFITPKTQRIFDNGTHMHLRYQCYFHCLRKPFVVQAPRLLLKWPLIGEADVRIQHPEMGKIVVELKSLNHSQFRSLTQPFPNHIDQVNSYLGMSGREWTGQIWYEDKNSQDVKVFVHELDRTAWEALWTRVSQIGNDLLAGRLPESCGQCLDVELCEDKIRLTDERLEALHVAREQSYPTAR